MALKHVAVQGDCIASIARRYGFSDPSVIWDDPANAALRARRASPGVLNPRDEVAIPARATRTETVATNAQHTFVVTRPEVTLRLRVEVPETSRYELTCDDRSLTGTIDPEGLIVETIPADLDAATITVWPDPDGSNTARVGAITWALKVGHVDPLDTVSGVQGRLASLGYYHGPVDDRANGSLRGALARFQRDEGLTATGELDDATRAALGRRHDG